MENVVTIKRRKDFSRVYSKGKSYVCPFFVAYILKNRNKGVRIGITASKKIGNAVQRNRARRVIKESYRQISSVVPGNFDIVFVARRQATLCKSCAVRTNMLAQLKKAGLIT